MDKRSIEKLETLAEFYHRFLQLEPEEREWLYEGLEKGTKVNVRLLELILERSMTYEELATEIGQHPNTVIQKLQALSRGGFPINLTKSAAMVNVGRPRTLARRLDESDVVAAVEKMLVKSKAKNSQSGNS